MLSSQLSAEEIKSVATAANERAKEFMQQRENMKIEVETIKQSFENERQRLSEEHKQFREASAKNQEELQTQLSIREQEIKNLQLEIESVKKKFNEISDLNKRFKEEAIHLNNEIDEITMERDKLSRTLQVNF